MGCGKSCILHQFTENRCTHKRRLARVCHISRLKYFGVIATQKLRSLSALHDIYSFISASVHWIFGYKMLCHVSVLRHKRLFLESPFIDSNTFCFVQLYLILHTLLVWSLEHVLLM